MRYSKKIKQFRAIISVDDLYKVLHGLYKEPIIEPLKFKMAYHKITSGRKIIRYWWNLVHKCRFGTRWQSR